MLVKFGQKNRKPDLFDKYIKTYYSIKISLILNWKSIKIKKIKFISAIIKYNNCLKKCLKF